MLLFLKARSSPIPTPHTGKILASRTRPVIFQPIKKSEQVAPREVNMITKELLHSEIDKLETEYVEQLYVVIKIFWQREKTATIPASCQS